VDLDNSTQYDSLSLLDARLDQNIFVGLAIEKLRNMPDTYENGETIALAIFAWVPRFIWPGKPERGGSTLIDKHTGKDTAFGTTFGAGPIFEFYVNFAYWGVFLGLMIIGALVRYFDIRAERALRTGTLTHCVQYHLAGLALLDPLADVFFLVTAVASAFVVGLALSKFETRWEN
jgi:hypothetical protein